MILGILLLNCSCLAGVRQEREPGMTNPAGQSEGTPSAIPSALKTISPTLQETSLPVAATRPLPLESEFDNGEQMEQNTIEPDSATAKERINFASSDLAQELGVEPSAVRLIGYEEKVWRDGSLGCPQPGMMYTQSLVPGYLIQLEVDGQSFNYHGAEGRDPFLCDNQDVSPESLPGP